MAWPMRSRVRLSGRFSSREIVDCEHSRAVLRQAPHRQLEHRIVRRRIGIVAVLVARGDHQHAEADDLVEAVQDPLRLTRVVDAGSQTSGDAEPLLDLAQRQQTAVGGQRPPSKRARSACRNR